MTVSDINDLAYWMGEFNQRGFLKQKTINVKDLKSPEPIAEGISFDDKKALKENNVLDPNLYIHIPAFFDPFEGIDEIPQTVLIIPTVSSLEGRKVLPLAIDLSKMDLSKESKFIPESVALKNFLSDVDPYNRKIETGLYFEVQKPDERRVRVVVPLGNMPLAIDIGDAVYIIGLDKVLKVQE